MRLVSCPPRAFVCTCSTQCGFSNGFDKEAARVPEEEFSFPVPGFGPGVRSVGKGRNVGHARSIRGNQ